MARQSLTEDGGSIVYHDMVVDTPSEFKVRTSVYTDERIFNDEIQRIFGDCWVYVGHESEVSSPGDYQTHYIGKEPILICRGPDQEVRIFFNTCRHRGNVLCRDEKGHKELFRCSYHGWVYDCSGALIGLAESKGYREDFQTGIGGLVPVPRVAIYRGLIFASLQPQGMGLEEYLGEAMGYIDLWVERSPRGVLRVLSPHKFVYPGNWKLQADNGHDSYHGRYVHESAMKTLERFVGRPALEDKSTARHGQGFVREFAWGHGLMERPGNRGELSAELLKDYTERLTDAYGPERAQEIAAVRHLFIFPNLYLMDDNIRVIHPVAVDKTVIYSYFVWLEGVSEEMNRSRLKNLQWRLSQTGFFATDDLEMFAGCQTGMRGSGVEWLNFSRGLHRETMLPNGDAKGLSSDETPQRSLYREWARRMSEL